ncbi:polysaccharide deacetylase family protein [Aquiflexum sp.]|uniref:polysaccharide deacetylase family protein n=1 Tax=Aquiflexum sp. TaxID=1872584 RepID=UPI0035934AB0
MDSKQSLISFILVFILVFQTACRQEYILQTEILKWPEGKKAAISLTYDDGTYNQFHVALPIMEELNMKGTFYINTGEMPTSSYRAKFLGRDPQLIVKETATIKTSKDNIFERASLIRFLDIPNAVSFHDRAGATYEQGREEAACQIVDEAFELARKSKTQTLVTPKIIDGPMIDWDEIREYAKRGHEFGVHTISHPRLAVLDEANLLYELEKCRDEIEEQLGREYLFSAECPFGTENERVMEYALDMFPATRNRMPEDYLEEINRSGKFDPREDYGKEYIQWQRGPLSKTSPELMNSWVDDILTREDTWLVLVFHGIQGIGWEAIPEDRIRNYFEYIASKSSDIWVGTFAQVTKYMRQRMETEISMAVSDTEISVDLSSDLDPYWYTETLTLKTYIPETWKKVNVNQQKNVSDPVIQKDNNGLFVQYQADPQKGKVVISRIMD